MAEVNFKGAACAQSFCELFGKIDRAVLAAGTAERDHQTFETTSLVVGDAGVDE